MKVLRILSTLILTGIIFIYSYACPAMAEKKTTVKELETVITAIQNKYFDQVPADKLLRVFITAMNSELEKNRIIIKELRYFTISSDLQADLSSLDALLSANFPAAGGITAAHLLQAGMEKMVSSLNDEGTRYYGPGEYHVKLMESSFRGGIGMFVDEEKDSSGYFVIVETLEGYPSYESGLRSGDRIVKVDGTDVEKLELHQLAEMVIGEIGSTLRLTIRQKGTQQPRDIELQRVALNPNPRIITSTIVEDTIGEMKFKFLGFRMEQETWNELTALIGKKIKGLIIDLRNNAGYPDAAISLTGLFIPPQTSIATEIYNGSQRLFVAKNANHFKLPLVILINEYSSSASSIMAGALAQAGRARIVGMPSRWRYLDTEKLTLDDGSVLTVSTKYYELPDGMILKGRKEAVKPTVEVPQDPFVTDPAEDLQLQKAIELIKAGIK